LAIFFGFRSEAPVSVIDLPYLDSKSSYVSVDGFQYILQILGQTNTTTYVDEIRVKTVSSLLSHIGGIYGVMAGIYVFLFGVPGGSPWGFVQYVKIYFKRDSEIKKAEEDVNAAFGTSSGVPLADDIRWPAEGGLTDHPPRVEDVAQRLANLEKVLSEFYLDTKFLNRIKKRNLKDVNVKPLENDAINV